MNLLNFILYYSLIGLGVALLVRFCVDKRKVSLQGWFVAISFWWLLLFFIIWEKLKDIEL